MVNEKWEKMGESLMGFNSLLKLFRELNLKDKKATPVLLVSFLLFYLFIYLFIYLF